MARLLVVLAAVLLVAACGKNDPNALAGLGYAPYPPNGGYPSPYSGFPQVGYPYGSGSPTNCVGAYCSSFYPTGYNGYPNGGYPSGSYPGGSYPGYPGGNTGGYPYSGYPNYYTGYPGAYPNQNQMTPWMPLSYWMNQDPNRQQYYNQFMNGWNQYAASRGWNNSYFPGFWLDYARRYWSGTSYDSVYRYFTANVYPWVNWQTQFPSYYQNPVAFWRGYYGMPYVIIDTWFPLGSSWGNFSL